MKQIIDGTGFESGFSFIETVENDLSELRLTFELISSKNPVVSDVTLHIPM